MFKHSIYIFPQTSPFQTFIALYRLPISLFQKLKPYDYDELLGLYLDGTTTNQQHPVFVEYSYFTRNIARFPLSKM